ncbi:PD-(D/E)XK nuclease family protein [Alicyclobacillus sp. ALC3]|uniref:PD-(D/E)XK nuclease family protein n=1 Tax=Alicyclobacillus sp. ALC3 TaxID=2796143 RepID=UPI00237900C0|nr:PD-(D/E)XK nuclease family protein [Alicyclobacillus sp. ALC3]WDL97761.1 PD-(D/E)XK nuclease family protein [Alicyclobacillus sp. ALC3]
MEVLLGSWLDGAAYPDAMGEADAAVGRVVTGFRGLVGVLETILGLTAPPVSEARRVAEWVRLIQSSGYTSLPFAESFRVDPWNTAKELLRRRDELVLAGWDAPVHMGGGRWLEALTALEASHTNRTPGFADRMRAVLQRLREPAHVEIDQITLLDQNDALWEAWQRDLVAELCKCGVRLKWSESSELEAEGDLGHLQRAQTGGEPALASGDSSVMMVRAENEWEAADFVATWLGTKGMEENTVLIRGDGSLTLGEVLHQRGLPSPGVEKPSRWREVLQVLPLAIETYWEPVRIEAMLQFLSLEDSPVPRRVRHELSRAISNAPGIGGRQWAEALETAYRRSTERWAEEGLSQEQQASERAKLDKRISEWIDHRRFHPDSGIPVDELRRICSQVAVWAHGLAANRDDDGMLLEAARQAAEVADVADALGTTTVSRLQLQRILDAVSGGGVVISEIREEAAPWGVVEHPGQLWAPADAVVWWGFHDSKQGPATRTWTSAERMWLRDRGVEVPDHTLASRRQAAAWRRVAHFAGKRIIFVAPKRVAGEATTDHPLWSEVKQVLCTDEQGLGEAAITYDASDLRRSETVRLAGAEIRRVTQTPAALPGPIRDWQVPAGIALREKESASSLDTLLGCSLAWGLHYAGKVRSGNVASLPSNNQTLGTLMHEVLSVMLQESMTWSSEVARVRAGELFDELVPTTAAVLLEPKNAKLRRDAKTRFVASIEQLFELLAETGIELKKTEATLVQNWGEGVDIEGRLDLVGEAQGGEPVVIDLKWSWGKNYYRELLGRLSVQLTVYLWLVAEGRAEELPGFYFLLTDGTVLARQHPNMPRNAQVSGPSQGESLALIRQEIDRVLSELSEGRLTATGIVSADTAEALASALVKPKCRFCDYQAICGLTEVAK